jgi:hypothetical protein
LGFRSPKKLALVARSDATLAKTIDDSAATLATTHASTAMGLEPSPVGKELLVLRHGH